LEITENKVALLLLLAILVIIPLPALLQFRMILDMPEDLIKGPQIPDQMRQKSGNESAESTLETGRESLKIKEPAPASSTSSIAIEKVYYTEDGKFKIHYKNVDEDYVKFVGHAFNKAREFQFALGFNDITQTKPDAVVIYVKDLIYNNKTSDVVIDQNQLKYFLVSDDLKRWQIYLTASHAYFKAVQASYYTLEYEPSEDRAWIDNGIARFITLYTAMNDPGYKQYGYLNSIFVEEERANGYAPYQVPRITKASLQSGITKLGDMSVSYWYYLHKLYGMQIIEDMVIKSGPSKDDSIRIISSVLNNYNTTFEFSIAEWYESLGFWNKGKLGDFSVYEGLILVDDELFEEYRSSELPLIEDKLSPYGASFIKLEFDSRSPVMQVRFFNPNGTTHVHVYVYNSTTEEYYHQLHEVEKDHVDFWVWTENAEINFIVIGGEKIYDGFEVAGV